MSDLRRAILTILCYALLAVVSINVIYALGYGKRLTPEKVFRLENLQSRARGIVQQVLGTNGAGREVSSDSNRSSSSSTGASSEHVGEANPSPSLSETEPTQRSSSGRNLRRTSLPTLRERPEAYRRLFSWAAKTYGVEIALIRAVARAESAGDPAAISPDGAIGIMQLMPKTARRYRKVKSKRLHLPSLNIDIGTAHLRWLVRRVESRFPNAYEDDRARIQLIASGYNAGWERVLQYRGVPPYRETRTYVRRVWRFYRHFSSSNPV